MAAVTQDPLGVSFDTWSVTYAAQTTTMAQAAAITKGMMCYIDGNGNAVPCDATSANAKVAGIALDTAAIGNPVTLAKLGTKCHYAAPGTLTPGATLYLDVTANLGGLNTAPTTGDAIGVARALTDQDIEIVRVF